MLIIGHRGAAGLAPENTLESLRAGAEADADILEFDVRLTSDDIPVLSHGARLHGRIVSRTSLENLRTAGPVTLLADVLDEFFGTILLNLEYKPLTGVEVVYKLLRSRYIKKDDDWDSLLISSFHILPLVKLRRRDKHVNLALLHSINPFAFITYHRKLRLSAVGWHRLHVNRFAIEMARRAGIFTYVYTVNLPQTALRFEERGVDGVVTDYPDKLARKV